MYESERARRLLTPTLPAPRRPCPLIAADTESLGLRGDNLANLRWHGNGSVWYDSPEALLDSFLTKENRSKWLGFHNLEYDLAYFVPRCKELLKDGWTIDYLATPFGKVIAIILHKSRHVWKVVDTYALLPVPLAKLATLAGMEKLDIGLKDGEIFDPRNPTHRAYAERDVEMLQRAYERYADIIYDQFKVNLGITGGATGMRALKRCLPRAYWRQRPEVEEDCRHAYFGGFVHLETLDKLTNLTHLDMNAMYAQAMRQGVPVGSGCFVTEEWPDRPAIYRVRASVPESTPRTILPLRLDRGVAWPTGEFETWCTSLEIAQARADGATVDVIGGYVFERTEDVFGTFVQKCEELEVPNKGTALGDAVKYLRNPVYGKLGQKSEQTSIVMKAGYPGNDYTPVIDEQTGEIVEDLWACQTVQEHAYQHIVWAVWITANARLLLHRTVQAIGQSYYEDTDSMVVDRDALAAAVARGDLALGTGYGEWKIECNYELFAAIAPKNRIGQLPDGRTKRACKGIPLDRLSVAAHWSCVDGHTVTVPIRTVTKTLGVIANQPMYQDSTRSVATVLHSKAWRVVNRRVRPIHLLGAPPDA